MYWHCKVQGNPSPSNPFLLLISYLSRSPARTQITQGSGNTQVYLKMGQVRHDCCIRLGAQTAIICSCLPLKHLLPFSSPELCAWWASSAQVSNSHSMQRAAGEKRKDYATNGSVAFKSLHYVNSF